MFCLSTETVRADRKEQAGLERPVRDQEREGMVWGHNGKGNLF